MIRSLSRSASAWISGRHRSDAEKGVDVLVDVCLWSFPGFPARHAVEKGLGVLVDICLWSFPGFPA